MRNKAICLALCVLLVSYFVPDAVTAQPEKGKAAAPVITDVSKKFIAFYFHGNFRCDNCRKIEQYSREAIEKYFVEQLKTGELEFEVVNTDLPENQHFIQDYRLYTGSLVIAEFKGSTQLKWKNLTGVWNNLDDQEAFYDYVKTEIQTYLESA